MFINIRIHGTTIKISSALIYWFIGPVGLLAIAKKINADGDNLAQERLTN
jgi:hypothetical protein